MHKFGFEIFSEHPLMGIGVGGFKNYNRSSNSQVSFLTKPESTWLGILIEGGAIYLLCMIIFFMNNLCQSVLKYKKDPNNDMAMKSIFININFIIIFFFNDFLDLMFWFSTAFFLAGSYIKARSNNECAN
jgi:O-antigen ligase